MDNWVMGIHNSLSWRPETTMWLVRHHVLGPLSSVLLCFNLNSWFCDSQADAWRFHLPTQALCQDHTQIVQYRGIHRNIPFSHHLNLESTCKHWIILDSWNTSSTMKWIHHVQPSHTHTPLLINYYLLCSNSELWMSILILPN